MTNPNREFPMIPARLAPVRAAGTLITDFLLQKGTYVGLWVTAVVNEQGGVGARIVVADAAAGDVPVIPPLLRAPRTIRELRLFRRHAAYQRQLGADGIGWHWEQ